MISNGSAFRGRWALRALAGLVGFVASASPLVAQFAVSPVIVQMPLGESETETRSIRIDNEGENAMQFRVYAMDFDQDRAGNHLFSQPGSTSESCATRLSFAPDALSVPAGGHAVVQVRLAAAADASTCWSMVFIEAPSARESMVQINQRIGVKIYGLGAPGETGGEMLAAEAHPVGDSVEVKFAFRNPGRWPLRPSGVVEVRDVTGEVVTTAAISPFSVLPGHDREVGVLVPVEGVPSGRYLAVPVLDFGADFLAGAQIDFRLPD